MAMDWYALHTKPHKERQVDRLLRYKGLETYLPLVKVNPQNPRAAKVRPYFPGYLFVRPAYGRISLSAVRWTPGLLSVVQYGDEPAAVPEAFMRTLMRRIAEIKQAGGLTLDGLQPGDRVQVTRGPLEGYEAIFDTRLRGVDRVRILLYMLGRTVPVDVNAGDIQKARPRRR